MNSIESIDVQGFSEISSLYLASISALSSLRRALGERLEFLTCFGRIDGSFSTVDANFSFLYAQGLCLKIYRTKFYVSASLLSFRLFSSRSV